MDISGPLCQTKSHQGHVSGLVVGKAESASSHRKEQLAL